MSLALISLAAEIGAPFIRDILAKKIGSQNATLATDVLGLIAGRVGQNVGIDDLDDLIKSDPETVKAAVREVEAMTPEMIGLYTAGLEGQYALQLAEAKGPLWAWAWRPLAMYGFGVLWFWNLIALHVLNAWFKIALPQTDLGMLFQLNSVYMALYLGGHTLKSLASTKWGDKK